MFHVGIILCIGVYKGCTPLVEPISIYAHHVYNMTLYPKIHLKKQKRQKTKRANTKKRRTKTKKEKKDNKKYTI